MKKLILLLCLAACGKSDKSLGSCSQLFYCIDLTDTTGDQALDKKSARYVCDSYSGSYSDKTCDEVVTNEFVGSCALKPLDGIQQIYRFFMVDPASVEPACKKAHGTYSKS